MSARQNVLNYLRSEVLGPRNGPNELLADPPFVRYLLGTLYPHQVDIDVIREEEEEDGPSAPVTQEELVDDPVTHAHDWMPSSCGLSFYFEGDPALICEVWGAAYQTIQEGRARRWQRSPIHEDASPEIIPLTPPANGGSRASSRALSDRGQVDALWRSVGGGWLVTVTLQNRQIQDQKAKLNPDLCLHQVGLKCYPSKGTIREYPSISLLSNDPEEQELRVLYRSRKIFAVGHGCAAEWETGDSTSEIKYVVTAHMPSFEVPPLTYEIPEHRETLLLRRLADDRLPTESLVSELGAFVDTYDKWIDRIDSENRDVPSALKDARARLLGRLRESAKTMRKGVTLVGSDGKLRAAFRLANRAMLMQMRHTEPDLGGTKRDRDQMAQPVPAYDALNKQWRPFQLAFQLLTLPSLSSEDDPDRDLVDLIWFPTGGGKTEAYLSIAACEIFLRRLRWGDNGAGTAVLTRYTLRLLTAQQFQRAAALICASELLRRTNQKLLGDAPITLGLWVGESVSPNEYQDAVEKVDALLEEPEPRNPFQLEQCPWCGTEIIPTTRTEDRTAYGVTATAGSFKVFCPSKSCEFHQSIPVSVIDEDLYAHPPTMLVGTIDKFARLAWEPRAGAFFGTGDRKPPSLIIQDELHLLTGPLGTTAGVYEAAVDGLIRLRGGKPKIIASTATARRADQQVVGLFDRRIRLFPSPGLQAADSFFAKEDSEAPGRLYVGVMSQSHTMSKTMVDVGAALLQAPIELSLQGGDRDAYWTLVVYHNSLRELGRTVTQANDDIRARLTTIAQDQSKVRNLGDDDIVELTSNVGGDKLPALLARLTSSYDKTDVVSFLATSSMLSVGVDVPRLGLMVMHGQPKTTAEYIQSTSRVGRTSRAPGLVITLFSATKPRDRSHYESFRGYHQALYRNVEPASVTPYSLPSRNRALHAALVILVRHGTGASANDAAGRIGDNAAAVSKIVRLLGDRVRAVDGREAQEAQDQLEKYLEEWGDWAKEAKGLGKALYYVARTKQHHSLLKDFGTPGPGWETLHSMRNVDRDCPVTVYGET